MLLCRPKKGAGSERGRESVCMFPRPGLDELPELVKDHMVRTTESCCGPLFTTTIGAGSLCWSLLLSPLAVVLVGG